MRAIGEQSAVGLPDLEPAALTCSDEPRRLPLRLGSAEDVAPDLLRLPVVEAVRCTDGRGPEPVDGEQVRIATLGYVAGAGFCPGSDRARVGWSLRLADGAVHSVVVDGARCGAVTVDGIEVGTAGDLLAALATD